jgi:hypothetical protein
VANASSNAIGEGFEGNTQIKRCAMIQRAVNPRQVVVLSLLAFLGLVAYPLGATFGRWFHGASPSQHSGMSPNPIVELDFGTIARGEQKEITFPIRNPKKHLVEVSDIGTSCDCFAVLLQTNVIGPGEQIWAKAKVDFTHDAAFKGSLRLSATGKSPTHAEAIFEIVADVTVE